MNWAQERGRTSVESLWTQRKVQARVSRKISGPWSNRCGKACQKNHCHYMTAMTAMTGMVNLFISPTWWILWVHVFFKSTWSTFWICLILFDPFCGERLTVVLQPYRQKGWTSAIWSPVSRDLETVVPHQDGNAEWLGTKFSGICGIGCGLQRRALAAGFFNRLKPQEVWWIPGLVKKHGKEAQPHLSGKS